MNYNALSSLKCVHCDYEWPKPEPKHGDKAEAEPVMTHEIKDKWIAVDSMRLHRHQKFGDGLDSIVVEYDCGRKTYKEWICPEHHGYARAKFEMWWRAMGGKAPAPPTINEALARSYQLATARGIIIARDDNWWRVIKRRVERDGILFDIDHRFVARMAQKAESVA